MCEKLVFSVFVLLVLVTGSASGLDWINWDAGGDGESWSDTGNWDKDRTPIISDIVCIYNLAHIHPQVQMDCRASIGSMMHGLLARTAPSLNITAAAELTSGYWITGGNPGAMATVNMYGGALTLTSNAYFGYKGGTGTLNVFGGTIASIGTFSIGYGKYGSGEGPVSQGLMNMYGGDLTPTSAMHIGHDGGKGTLNVFGGTIISNATLYIGSGKYGSAEKGVTHGLLNMYGGLVRADTIELAGWTEYGNASILLAGGTLEANELIMGDSKSRGTVDINGGTLKIAFDRPYLVQSYIDDGLITFGGRSEPRFYMVMYDPVALKTTLTSCDPAGAWNPSHLGANVPFEKRYATWSPGDFAATTGGHTVYFGASPDDVNTNAIPVSTRQDNTSYGPGKLELGKTYYWRVAEVNEAHPGSPWAGNVWKFTVASWVVVDDMESYDTDGNEINRTWKDGTADNSSGSMVSLEQSSKYRVHTGKKAIRFDYNNSDACSFSEIESTPAEADWTREGVKILTIWFRGDSANGEDELYVRLSDGVHSAVQRFSDLNDPAKQDAPVLNVCAIQWPTWQEWNVDLSKFGDVDLAAVTKIAIGIGKQIPTNSRTGTVLIDDIRLSPPKPPVALEGDLNGDNVVDFKDFAIVLDNWLKTDEIWP